MERSDLKHNSNKHISQNLFMRLKEISVESGFKEQNRKQLYTILFQISNTYQRELSFNNSLLKVNYYEKRILPKYIEIEALNNEINGIEVLKKDIPRCVYNCIKDKVENERKYEPIKMNKLETPLIFLFNSKSLNYYYYQGYLDVAVYICLLFPENNSIKSGHKLTEAFGFLNCFSELLLKDYLVSPSKINDLFIQAANLLADIIGLIDSKLYDYFKGEGTHLILILSWLITLMAHDIHNIQTLLRLFDYLIFAEPYAIYILSALIITDELQNINEDSNNDYITQLQEIDLNTKITKEYIRKTEDFIIANHNKIDRIRKKYFLYFPTLCNTNYHGFWNFLFKNK